MGELLSALREKLECEKKLLEKLQANFHELRFRDAEADGGAQASEKQIVLALIEASKRLIASLRKAISTLEKEGVIKCRCGKSVEPARVLIVPGTDLCARCANAESPKGRRKGKNQIYYRI